MSWCSLDISLSKYMLTMFNIWGVGGIRVELVMQGACLSGEEETKIFTHCRNTATCIPYMSWFYLDISLSKYMLTMFNI